METFTTTVFRTSVNNQRKANRLKPRLRTLSAIKEWHIDFANRDNLLRIDSTNTISVVVIGILNRLGYDCVELD